MADVLALLVLAEAVLFVLTMAFSGSDRTRTVGEYVGTGFHLLLLPIIAGLPTAPVGQASGLAWVVCDVVASTGLIWAGRRRPDVGTPIFTPVRMAGHLFAAIWIALVSTRFGGLGLAVGCALALSFAVYTLAAGRIPEKALAVPGSLMVVWLLLLAGHLHQISL